MQRQILRGRHENKARSKEPSRFPVLQSVPKAQQHKRTLSASHMEEDIFQLLSPALEESSPTLADRKKKVMQAVNQLPKRQKEAIFLKYYENLDYQEVANLMVRDHR